MTILIPTRSRRSLSFLLFIVFVVFAAQGKASATTLTDQRQMFKTHIKDAEYRLALGAIKKINAANVIDREIVLRGTISRVTYEFENNVTENEAWLMLLDSLPGERRALYSCDGLECGSSNGWANTVFSIKQLYGLDQSQKYRAFSLGEKSDRFLSVYFVRRGTNRLYAQVDTIAAQGQSSRVSPSASVIKKDLFEKGFYAIPVLSKHGEMAFDSEEFTSLVSVLKSNPIARYYLVGHCYTAATFEQNQQCAQAYLDFFLLRLSEERIKKQRFEWHAVGNLAPNAALPENRVSLVLKR